MSSSLNSGGKSKRSRNSNSSDRSNSSNKKKNTNQKTLGMAWGANSLTSSKSSFRKAPFADVGSYMVEKNRKLRDQFDADASSSSLGDSGKPLFHGVSIFVDGFTVPSSQELRGYMLRYGGRFENYFSRHRVTHIICSNLPDSKIKNIRSFSGGLPVVKPTWVLDSVAANKLLNWVPYQLEQLNGLRGQPKLSAFFALKSNSSSEDAHTPLNSHMELEREESLPQGVTYSDSPSPEMVETVNYTTECSGETVLSLKEEPDSIDVDESLFHERIAGPSSSDVKSASNVKALQPSPHRSSASVSSRCLDNQNTKESSEPSIPGDSNQRHSTLGDPNFVKNYFKYSRLHFIGTWRNRYRKRFSNLPSNPNVSAHNVSQKAAIIHIDMDCFFVSVVIRNHPELQDKPVAVCHSDNPRGTAEISSANYPARDYGIKAGIFVRDAKALCPHLVIVPYNFEAYEEVADQFYDILHKHCNKVQAVSCDEAFLDVTDRVVEDPESLASIIRKEVVETTGCTASAGIAGNMLMARLATRTAKPDGQCFIPSEKVESYLSELPIKVLPGIGRVLEEKLKKQQIQTCGQLRMISKESLQKDFGIKTGDMLWSYCRGVDNRLVGVLQETKSVGADVNWGVRFNDLKDSHHFLVNLCNEVSLRLQGCGVQGRTITLKVKKRRKDAGEPTKYMGCGDCENLSHSMTVPSATDDVDVLQRISKQLFGSFHIVGAHGIMVIKVSRDPCTLIGFAVSLLCDHLIDVKEIRGIGLHVSKLENADLTKARQGDGKNALRSWLASTSANVERLDCPTKVRVDGDSRIADPSYQMQNNQTCSEVPLGGISMLPPIHDLDMEVIESLPADLFSEVNAMYNGKLSEIMNKNRSARHKGKEPLFSDSVHSDFTIPKNKLEGDRILEKNNIKENFPFCSSDPEKINQEKRFKHQEIQSVSCPGSGSSNLQIGSVSEERTDLMPASLSQIDISILQQLPEDLKVDILESLPAHRTPGCSSDNTRVLRECPDTISREDFKNHVSGLDSASENKLWVGFPPAWVYKFECSGCLILNHLAEMYYKSRSTGLLSSILQSTISVHYLSLDTINDGGDEAISSVCELLKQYIEVKIEFDIEEIYICFRLLKRFTTKSAFFLHVYEMVVPYLQASVTEHYGGNLNISLSR